MSANLSRRPPLRLRPLLASAVKALRRGLVPIVLLNALPSLPAIVTLLVNGEVSQAPTLADLVTLPASLILLVVAQGATIAGTHRLLRGQAFSPRLALRQTWQRLPTLLGAAFLSGIIILLGLAALVVPGLMAIALLYLTLPACMIERNGMVESLERSGELSMGYRWPLFGLFILTLLPAIGLSAAAGSLGDARSTIVEGLVDEAATMLLGIVWAVTATACFERLRQIRNAPQFAPILPEWAGGRT
ncbi:hypothetical protein [Labrys neptuniae]